MGHWEHRFRARYFMTALAPDNFALCGQPNRTITQCLHDLDYNQISAIMIPTCNAKMISSMNASMNALQRWSRCPPEPLGRKKSQGDNRHTPAMNPRHNSYNLIHFANGRITSSFKRAIDYDEAWDTLRLHTAHFNKTEKLGGEGDNDTVLLADRLQLELKPFLRDDTSFQ
eukprot:gene35629-46211_t